MIIEPKIKGFICTTAHPAGCEKNVLNNVRLLDNNGAINLPDIKNVLVVGASAGYGLASAMTASFSLGANVIAVALEKNAKNNRTATAGFYNLAAYKKQADARGLSLTPIIADAFSHQAKEKAGEFIDAPLDMLIYCIAAPARVDPDTGEKYSSALKPIGSEYRSKGIDLSTYKINENPISIAPASETEIASTVKVMGGEDLKLWVDYLAQNGKLRSNAIILAYSYIGPALTHDIYLNGTIGAAKDHLKQTIDNLNLGGAYKAYVSVNKAVVTQASSAIPALPLYISILFKVMKEQNIHEDCTEQIYRLFKLLEKSESGENLTDENGLIRIDDWEMRDDIQREVADRWTRATNDNLDELADLTGYRGDFVKLFGFGLDGIDYSADIDSAVDERALGFVNLTE